MLFRSVVDARRDVFDLGLRPDALTAQVDHVDVDRAGIRLVRCPHELRVALGQREVDVEPIVGVV